MQIPPLNVSSDAKDYFRFTYMIHIYIYISEISLNLYNYVNSREAIHRVICRLIIIIIVVVVVYRLSIRLLNSSLRMSSFATRIIHTSKTLWQNRAKFSLR